MDYFEKKKDDFVRAYGLSMKARPALVALLKEVAGEKGSSTGCKWQQMEDEDRYWTDCGNVFEFTADRVEHTFQFCPYCGDPLLR